MKKLALIGLIALASCSSQPAAAPVSAEVAAWQARAAGVTIIRDDWGVPHIYGKTDADVVFGLMYAQAEDDFNRVETNFINSQGRLAEAEGEAEIYRDLRMKLFIDPENLKADYVKSPDWLKALMNGWADGLNFYLHTHPDVKPRVITRFEPWMALSFSEGSIGGDIERVNIGQLEAGDRRSRFADVDLASVMRNVVEAYEAVVQDTGFQLEVTSLENTDAIVHGDQELLTQLFANLIENVLRHCPTGTTISMALASDNSHVTAQVADNGPGIPAPERDNVFRRFYRLERARSSPGHGLGLNLVAAIVDLHGATVALEDNAPGLRVAVAFPRKLA